jgi:hypothetical protein
MNSLQRALEFGLERYGHPVAEFAQVLADAVEFFLPQLRIDGEQLLECGRRDVDALQIQILRIRQVTDRRIPGAGFAIAAIDNPAQHA